MITMWSHSEALTVAYYCWLCVMALCSAIIIYTDVRYYWVPDVAVGLLLLVNGAAWALQLVAPNEEFTVSCLAGLGLLAWLAPQRLGTGDIKLLAVLALGCTGFTLYLVVCFSFFIGTLLALFLWLKQRQRLIPFAPCIVGGWWFSFFFSEECWQWLTYFL